MTTYHPAGTSYRPAGTPLPPYDPGPYYGQKLSAVATMVSFGDSITVDRLASDHAHGWSALVATGLGAVETNAGISGTLLQNSDIGSGGVPDPNNGRDRFVADLTDFTNVGGGGRKALCFIDYGYNDLRRDPADLGQVSEANYEADLREILNGLRANGYAATNIILGSVYYAPDSLYSNGSAGYTGSNRTIHLSYAAGDETIATEYGLYFADIYRAMLAANLPAYSDGVHPADTGHAVIADWMLHPTVRSAHAEIANFVAGPTYGGVCTLSWDAFSGAADYTVEVGTQKTIGVLTTSWAVGQTFTQVGLSKQFTLTSGNDYWGRVRGNFSDGTHTSWAFLPRPIRANAGSANTVTVYQDFMGVADNTTILATTPSVGSWTKLADSGAGSVTIQRNSFLGITGGRVIGVASGPNTHRDTVAAYATGNGQYGSVDIHWGVKDVNTATGIMLYAATATVDCVVALINDASIRIFQFVGGVATAIATYTWSPAVAANDHYRIRFEAKPTSQEVFVNGVSVLTAAINIAVTIPSAGTSVGLRLATGSATWSDGEGPQIEYCEFGSIT